MVYCGVAGAVLRLGVLGTVPSYRGVSRVGNRGGRVGCANRLTTSAQGTKSPAVVLLVCAFRRVPFCGYLGKHSNVSILRKKSIPGYYDRHIQVALFSPPPHSLWEANGCLYDALWVLLLVRLRVRGNQQKVLGLPGTQHQRWNVFYVSRPDEADDEGQVVTLRTIMDACKVCALL